MVAEDMEAERDEVDIDTGVDETIIELEEFERNEGMVNTDSDPHPPVPVNVSQDKMAEGSDDKEAAEEKMVGRTVDDLIDQETRDLIGMKNDRTQDEVSDGAGVNRRRKAQQIEVVDHSTDRPPPSGETTSPEPIIHVTGSERVEDASVPKVLKGRAPKSETMNTTNSSDPSVQPPGGIKSKHNFFKHTEEVTKMLEGLKEKDQEKKSKDTFLQSLTASHVTEREVENENNLGSALDLGKDRAKSLGKERTNDDDIATVTASDSNTKKKRRLETILPTYLQ